jgi:HEPN domain-containing protein
MDSRAPLIEDIVFHAQQAAEKCFEGLLAWHGVPFRKTHNLEELGESCLRLDPTLKSLADKAVPLTEYAWKFRYPGEPDVPSREEAAEAVAIAREVYESVLTRLPDEVRP